MEEKTYFKVKQYIENNHLLTDCKGVVAGVSGGADSVCMLHILSRLQREKGFLLVAVHVNHNVRADAGKDAKYVEQLCREMEIPFYLKEVSMESYARENKLSGEEAGRILRYQAFREVAESLNPGSGECKIAVAHNANDCAETMLFHMFRGSGLKGICGVTPARDNIIRPLLCLQRSEVEAYTQEQGLTFCNDSTNAEDIYTRNKIRHHILPYVEQEICSAVVERMTDLAEVLRETEAYMENRTVEAFERCISHSTGQEVEDAKGTLLQADLKVLLFEPPVLQKRILLKCLEKLTPHRKDITKQHIDNLVDLIQKDGCKQMSLPYELVANKLYDQLYIGTKSQMERMLEKPLQQELVTRIMDAEVFFAQVGQNIPENRYTKWFDYDKIATTLQFRTRLPGDYLTVDSDFHRKMVKDYMINEKIPKAERDSMKLVADGSHVLWIPGYRISQYYKVDENTKRVLEICVRGGHDGRTC